MSIGKRSGFKATGTEHGIDRSGELFAGDPAVSSNRRRMLADPFGPHDQLKQVPCCVSCAIAKAMESIDAARGSVASLSPMFHYYYARPGRSGWPWLTFEHGFRAAIQYGIASERSYPSTFKKSQFQQEIPAAARRDGGRHRLEPYNTSTHESSHWELTRTDRIREWKSTIDQGWPVLFGMHATENYGRLDHRHVNPLASPKLPSDGPITSQARHAVVALGYEEDDAGGAFRISDSRGRHFGENGRWWLPYDLVTSAFVIEAWTIRFISYGGDD